MVYHCGVDWMCSRSRRLHPVCLDASLIWCEAPRHHHFGTITIRYLGSFSRRCVLPGLASLFTCTLLGVSSSCKEVGTILSLKVNLPTYLHTSSRFPLFRARTKQLEDYYMYPDATGLFVAACLLPKHRFM